MAPEKGLEPPSRSAAFPLTLGIFNRKDAKKTVLIFVKIRRNFRRKLSKTSASLRLCGDFLLRLTRMRSAGITAAS